MSSWKKCTLGDCIKGDIKNGYSPNCPDNETGKWILGLGNLTEKGFNIKHIKPAPLDDKSVDDTRLVYGDFLISRSNTPDKVGRVMVFRDEVKNCSYPDLLMKFRLNDQLVDIDFLESYLRTHSVRKYIQRHAYGTSSSMVKINKRTVSHLPLQLPPLPEQKAIAELLAVWDAAIEKMEWLIELKERRLAAYGCGLFNRDKVKRCEGWKAVKLADVLDEHKHSSTGNEDVFSVSVHKGLVNQVEHLGRSFSAENTDHYNRVHYGDIVYTKSPTGDFPLGVVKQSHIDHDVIVSPLYGVFTPRTFEIGTVIDFYFESPVRARNYLFPIIQKGAKNTIAITNKIFLSNKMYLPVAPDVAQKIADNIAIAKCEIAVCRKLLDKYTEQKRGLMQRLLNGNGTKLRNEF